MIILDASVVIKWFSEEEYTEEALALREQIRYGEEQVIEPDLLLYELANALMHNPHFEVQDVCDALTSLFDMNIDIVTPLPEIIDVAIKLAFEHAITVYDAFYIALAQETGLILITADKKLYERVPSLEFVKFLGEL